MMKMRMESNGGSHRLHHHINQKQNLKYGQFSNHEDEIDHQVFDLFGNCNSRSNGKGKNRFTMPSPSSTTTATTMLSASTSSNSGVGFIEHPVSKLDTLAGVAIKYGVEVADIKKMNSLVTDLQMFALKSLQIPLPGRHQPSSFLSNGSDVPGQNSYEWTPPRGLQSDLFDSFQSLKPQSSRCKVSPAMSSLQGYYGLKPKDQKKIPEGFEMAVYRNGHSHHPEGGPYLKPSPASHPPLSLHRKTKSLANGFLDEKNGLVDKLYLDEVKEGESEKLVRRRQKSEADFTSIYTDLLIREESTGPAFSTITGKGLALRPKAGNRTTTDVDAGGLTSAQTGPGDLADGFLVVRKSSSATSLNDHDSISSSMWPTSKWNLKPDLQALSAAAITRPIFDGLPKPVTGRKNKTALD
ncbi:hypothetical protein POPTR_005G092800v4 [Populus trichocarpa]|uniref:Uncharacterized protein n=2 Tax=Populus trichocarpa TaxID=3694 RepID=A0ACC0SYT1_POPTR|nr:uncharacterized protein LOC7492078 [Populus trichocarpa]KAI9394439.1 hypothetical protein POPTR_005G092800v4 [Populus trichocarpa]